MALGPTRAGRRHDETAFVIRHVQRTISRVLDFLGYTIDDVVNDPEKRVHVSRLGRLSLRIERDLAREPWRAEARGAVSRGRPPSEMKPSGRQGRL